MKIQYRKLFASIGLCEGVGIGSSLLSFANVGSFYLTLNKPSWSPPTWLFAPVWTILYVLMGAALYLVWVSRMGKGKMLGFSLFGLQLVLNAVWTPLFFGLKSPLLGLLDIVPLWAVIMLMMWRFWRFNKSATLLLAPYIVWVTIASALNFSVFILNR
jgi:tryptophan-rich sensory protein